MSKYNIKQLYLQNIKVFSFGSKTFTPKYTKNEAPDPTLL